MRVAVGILMLIGAVLGLIMPRAIYGYIPGLLGWLPWVWALLVGGGGVYTLKRQNWKVCLSASILLLPVGTVLPFLMWDTASPSDVPNVPFAIVITTLFLMIGILPIIFITLRKREWAK